MKVKVLVRLKPGVLDVQGKAVEHSLREHGFPKIESVRIGKLIEIEVPDTTGDNLHAAVDSMCRTILVNQIVENYEILT